MYEFLAKIVAGIPTAVARWFIIPGLLVLTAFVWRDHERIVVMELGREVDAVRIALLVDTIKEQTAEIKRYREALEQTYRQNEVLLRERRANDASPRP